MGLCACMCLEIILKKLKVEDSCKQRVKLYVYIFTCAYVQVLMRELLKNMKASTRKNLQGFFEGRCLYGTETC